MVVGVGKLASQTIERQEEENNVMCGFGFGAGGGSLGIRLLLV